MASTMLSSATSLAGMALTQRVGTSSGRAPRALVVRADASSPSRRAILKLVTIAAPAAFVAPALALDITDDRPVGIADLQRSLDQARDDKEDQRLRFSYQNVNKLTLDDHKKRVRESLARLQSDIKPSVEAGRWSLVQQDLRHQMGTLRWDLDQLTASLDKQSRKQAQKLQDDAMRALEDVDYWARRKDQKKLSDAYASAVSNLGNVVSFLA